MATYVGTLRSPVWLAPKPARFGGPGILDVLARSGSAPPIQPPPDSGDCRDLPVARAHLSWCSEECNGRRDRLGRRHELRSCRWATRPDGSCVLTVTCRPPPDPPPPPLDEP